VCLGSRCVGSVVASGMCGAVAAGVKSGVPQMACGVLRQRECRGAMVTCFGGLWDAAHGQRASRLSRVKGHHICQGSKGITSVKGQRASRQSRVKGHHVSQGSKGITSVKGQRASHLSRV